MQKIKIPKVDPDIFHSVEIYKSKYYQSQWHEKIYLKPQIIAGMKIPKDTVISGFYQHIRHDSILNKTFVLGSELNKTLRYLYLKTLRNEK